MLTESPGDKETFWIGWELIGDSDYAFHPGEAGNMGVAYEKYESALKRVKGEDPATLAETLKEAIDKGPEWVDPEKEKTAEEIEAENAESEKAEEKKEREEASDSSEEKENPTEEEKAEPAGLRKRAAIPEDEMEQTKNYGKTNYTICAPQLVHMDRDGRPLWFNGWVLENKFDVDHPRLASFDSYMFETKKGSKTADWRLETNNMCCLISDRIHRFNKREKKVVDDLLEIAVDVGALRKRD